MSKFTVTSPKDPDRTLDLDIHALAPGAKLILQCKEDMDAETMQRLGEQVQRRFPDVPFIVIGPELDVHVF
jgi:hypothetical protein